MNLPGFGAEASLYSSGQHYWSAPVDTGDGSSVEPQMLPRSALGVDLDGTLGVTGGCWAYCRCCLRNGNRFCCKHCRFCMP